MKIDEKNMPLLAAATTALERLAGLRRKLWTPRHLGVSLRPFQPKRRG